MPSSAHSPSAGSGGSIGSTGVRLDKWLWAARFFKTRSIAVDEIGKGRVTLNGQAAKASRDVRVGDVVKLRQGQVDREVKVAGLSSVRGPAPVAQTLYEETPHSLAARERAAEARRLAPNRPTPSSRVARRSRTAAASRTGTAGPPAWTDAASVEAVASPSRSPCERLPPAETPARHPVSPG